MSSPVIAAVISALHVLGIALSLGSVLARTRALRAGDVDRVLAADNLWGLSALVMIGTGLARAFGGLEKGTPFYLHNPMFHLKMGLLALVLVLEVWPMATLLRWRLQQSRGQAPDLSRMPLFARMSAVQCVVLVAMVFAATAMARGLGMG